MKRTTFKSFVALMLSVILAFSVVGVVAVAADVTVVKAPRTSFYQGIDWSYDKSGKISFIGGVDLSGTVLSYNGKTVEYTVGKWPNMNAKSESGTWKTGNNTIKIYCDDFGTKVYATLTIKLVEAENISVVTPPKKTLLNEGSDWTMSGIGDVEFTEFDMTGTRLKVMYKDGTAKQITYPENKLIGWAVSQDIDYLEPGHAVLYATFAGLRAPFNVIFLAKGADILGDVNNDKKVDSGDALMILQHSVGKIALNSTQLTQADVTKEGNVDSTDALTVLQFVVGKRLSF